MREDRSENNHMTTTEFAKIAEAVAWPGLSFFAIVLFYRPIEKLLDSLAASMKVKSIKVKAFGVEAELTPLEVKAAVDELLQEISDPTNELSEDEVRLLDRIAVTEGRQTVIELEPVFVRGGDVHNQLRRLRDRQLIRPVEGGRWRSDKHPVLTRFGKLVLDLRSRAGPRSQGNGPGAPLSAP
jgi:hypothetical protein